jgi:hypothetical protein
MSVGSPTRRSFSDSSHIADERFELIGDRFPGFSIFAAGIRAADRAGTLYLSEVDVCGPSCAVQVILYLVRKVAKDVYPARKVERECEQRLACDLLLPGGVDQ